MLRYAMIAWFSLQLKEIMMYHFQNAHHYDSQEVFEGGLYTSSATVVLIYQENPFNKLSSKSEYWHERHLEVKVDPTGMQKNHAGHQNTTYAVQCIDRFPSHLKHFHFSLKGS